MKKIIIFIITITLVCFLSCKPEPIDLIVAQNPQKMAISSQYLNGGMFGVSVSKTFEALQVKNNSIDSTGFNFDTSLLVGNAQVFLKSDSYKIQLVEVEKGIYLAENAMVNNFQNYDLEVFMNGKLQLKAQTQKAPQVNFDSVFVYRTNNDLKVFYRIEDNPNQENYYVVNYFIKNNRDDINQEPTPELIAKRMLEQNISIDLLTDKEFKNNNYQINKTVSNNYVSDTLVMSLSNISKGYYQFLVAQKRAGTLFNQLRGEVINFPTNITNGYGYFQLSEPDIRVIDVIN